MKCVKCGAELGANDVFCPNCGASIVENNLQGEGQANANQFSNYGPLNSQPNYGMQPNMQQNNVNQPNNMQQPNNNFTPAPKKSNAMTYVAVIAILIAIALAVVVVVKVVLPSAKGEEKGQTNETTTSETPKAPEETTYKVKFGGFRFSVPESVEVDTSDEGYLYLGNEDDEWYASISIAEGSFSKLKSNKSSMKSSLYQYVSQSSYGDDFEISDPKVETVDGVEFLTLELELAGEKDTIVYAGLNSSYFLGMDLYLGDNSQNDVLKILAKIIDSAEYKGGTSNIEQESLGLEDINKAFENLLKDEQTNQVDQGNQVEQTNQVNETNQTVEE